MTVTRAVWGFLEERDLRLMRRVNRWRAPRWVRLSMLWVTRLGDGWLWYALGILLCFFGGAERYRAVAAEGIAALAAILIFRALKTMSRRARPCHIERHCWAVIAPPDEYSFPFGPYHDGVRHQHRPGAFLSRLPALPVARGRKHRRLANYPRNALPDGCPGGCGDRSAARIRLRVSTAVARKPKRNAAALQRCPDSISGLTVQLSPVESAVIRAHTLPGGVPAPGSVPQVGTGISRNRDRLFT